MEYEKGPGERDRMEAQSRFPQQECSGILRCRGGQDRLTVIKQPMFGQRKVAKKSALILRMWPGPKLPVYAGSTMVAASAALAGLVY